MIRCLGALGTIRVPLGVGLLAASAFGADQKKTAVKPPAPTAKVAAPRPPAIAPPAATPEEPQKQLERIMKMNPVQRQRWLESLPPQRRQNIERRLSDYLKTPPAERNLATRRAEMLQGLPEQRRNQVRRSVRQFEEIPEERRLLMSKELKKMSFLSDEDRLSYMNGEEFRNKYSPTEQQIMRHILEITPQD